ncbi:hypothetical protein TGAMA5MH_11082 [Trichoderma gamsii]|uniref:Reverse transcriptase domain-containing protein n=1 Tax=Trichoderma gamsii TaxID=398673 RepID=A0A2K0SUS4_9HYPO|nr:hypothetical protein TGAMA5MH_11082 [Trichoderma gamsii]
MALDCTAENKKALYRTVPWVPIPFLKSVPLSLEIAEEETREAVLGTGNTSPGSDGITVALLAAAWPHMAKAVHMLFLSAVRVGYHPRAFRNAEVVMIPKPGKAPHNTAKKWRPISLLSCIGKGLERLLARRVARTAIAFGIIPAQYFGALPKRACTDLVACLIHDIEKALAKDMIAALITLDVSGAFDIVLCKRLIYRLRQQGWPDAFVHWAESFMTGRTVTIRTTEGEILPEINLSCGTPQGSPISPIIFMLYLSPLLRLGNEDRRFGYADDVSTLATGTTPASVAQRLQKEINLSLNWGAANMISFDPAKAELILFYRRKEQDTIRWLGVFLDSKLTLKRHIKVWSLKALQAATFLRSLNKTRKGSPPNAVAQAAKAVVLSTTLFGAEAWYTGPTKSSLSIKKRKTI